MSALTVRCGLCGRERAVTQQQFDAVCAAGSQPCPSCQAERAASRLLRSQLRVLRGYRPRKGGA